MMYNGGIEFGATTITYDTVFSKRRKHAAIAVYPNKKVIVTAPSGLSPEEIQRLVQKRASWILEKVDWFNQISHLTATKEYVNGETFLYLGRQYRLKMVFINGDSTAKLRGKYFEINLPENSPEEERHELAKRVLSKWYIERAEKKIGNLVNAYSMRLHIAPPRFKVKYQQKRWGSCSNGNILHLNMRIIMAPMSQVEYVVAHELCHLKFKNHSSEFWQLLRLIMPDYEVRKDDLSKSGWRYAL